MSSSPVFHDLISMSPACRTPAPKRAVICLLRQLRIPLRVHVPIVINKKSLILQTLASNAAFLLQMSTIHIYQQTCCYINNPRMPFPTF